MSMVAIEKTVKAKPARQSSRNSATKIPTNSNPLLTRLKNSDMLTYRWVESNSGPPRKYFSLTPKGEEFYMELEATWNELANAVNRLASKKESLVSTVINENEVQADPSNNQ